MSDDELIRGLEECSLPQDSFHHAEHLRAAWIYLRRYPAAEAIDRYSRTLKGHAASLGKADRYHETITWAYMLLLNERMRSSEEMTWAEFAATNADLLDWKEPVLKRYYRDETLRSDLARRVFVMPDGWLNPRSPGS